MQELQVRESLQNSGEQGGAGYGGRSWHAIRAGVEPHAWQAARDADRHLRTPDVHRVRRLSYLTLPFNRAFKIRFGCVAVVPLSLRQRASGNK